MKIINQNESVVEAEMIKNLQSGSMLKVCFKDTNLHFALERDPFSAPVIIFNDNN